MRRRSVLLGAGAACALAACRRQPRMAAIPAGATVLALGDSITFGTGASADASYPAVLASLTRWNVVNAGVPGDTSALALARLPQLLQQHSPALVIVSIGGNDFLRHVPPAETRANIRAICEQARASNTPVVLVAVPEVSALAAVARSLGDHPMYGNLASELKLPLYEGGWARVLSDPALRSDPIHANDRGYEMFARGLAERLREIGLLA
ncbi:GDSL-type esterase/lipase family protein [Ramlibacter sp. AN1133]|uniref:GDSL-type esterase/lipase family protein n=1 Tax=Ramlibacter sp. AN1133 TaxID=3133429 RepID=UPI0030C60FFD